MASTQQFAASALAVALTLGIAGGAQACRVNQPPEARVAHAYDAVVLARVERAAPLDGRGWRAQATGIQAVEGEVGPAATVFEIGRTGEPAACDDGQAIAGVGETWALYLSRRPDGGFTVSQSYPLDLARRIDPRFQKP
ncbi:hypothetical protein [Caulobacter hibisci]|uniref:Lipoprotein n=1 Tax=Caulobacter hibisci TaxID=2035993 RepID=A0ABS0SYU1_9CAUL|nr:hypothetical protein [Caulobacter hibisci]MBI1684792.1 hypothetical protein [Caulobacter hibisci]